MDTARENSSPYRALLETAYALGRADGDFAARLEPATTPLDAGEPWCRGRSPAEFACMLWRDRPGRPPSGLEINGPLWYARGFADAVATAHRRSARQDAAAWALIQRCAAARLRG